jgi:general stress protein YciG
MSNMNEHEQPTGSANPTDKPQNENKQTEDKQPQDQQQPQNFQGHQPSESPPETLQPTAQSENAPGGEGRPIERNKGARPGARGTAAMDPQTRKEVARKGGLAVSRNKQHMAEIGRKGGQSVSKNREHMAQIGRKGGAASRGHR